MEYLNLFFGVLTLLFLGKALQVYLKQRREKSAPKTKEILSITLAMLCMASVAFAEGPVLSATGVLRFTPPQTDITGGALLHLREYRLMFCKTPFPAADEACVIYGLAAAAIPPTAPIGFRLYGTTAKPLVLEPGQWYLFIAAVDVTGYMSAQSKPIPFYYLPVPPMDVTGVTLADK